MDAPQRYRKIPLEIEAIRWTGSNQAAVADFMGSSPVFNSDGQGGAYVLVVTLEGTMQASIGDWVIRGALGEFYPCRDDVFCLTYECVG